MSKRNPAEEKLQELAAKRMKLSAPAYSRAALIMGCGVHEKGTGCYIVDQEGRRFLDLFDAYGNQAFGYGHPRLLNALRRQLESGHTNTSKIFFDEMPVRLAEALAGLTDNALPCSFLTNGGAEAIEHALKLARAHTRRPKFITARNAYHGKTFAAMSAACRPEYEEMFSPLMPEFQSVPFGDTAALEQAIDEKTAAVLIETVQSEGGIVAPPPGYLQRLRELCDERGALLILDEIQAGFGRTGRFFAFEHAGILPDIICIGKSFGGGMLPSAAILSREKFWAPFRTEPLSFGSSLGGNPLSSAVGLETIAMASDPAFLQDVRSKGELVGRRLAALARAYPDLIASTHGVGLLQGLTLVDPALTGLVLRLMYERGVITSFCLFDVSVVRVEPPLIITESQLEEGLSALEAALKATDSYVRGLPGGALGSCRLEASLEVPVPPAILFESLCNLDHLYQNSPIVTSHQQAGPGRMKCEGRIDDISIQWEDLISVAPDRREVEQRAVDGFWQGFTRRWTAQPAPGGQSSRLVFQMEWDVGTGGFERVLSLRLRYSLEKAVDRALSAFKAPVVAA
jgi:putrescine aminotransferase